MTKALVDWLLNGGHQDINIWDSISPFQYQIDDIESGILLVKSMNDEKQGNLTIPGHRNHGYFIYISPASS